MRVRKALLLLSVLGITGFVASSCAGRKGMNGMVPPARMQQAHDATDTSSPAVPQTSSQIASPLLLGDVFFDYDRSFLREDALVTLRSNGDALRPHPEARVRIEGHCDERGTVEYNLALGDRRASAARNYLVSYGIPVSQLSTISYGEERPFDRGHDEAAWASNRRAAFVIFSDR